MIVVGAGAAGLLASLVLARLGRRVVLFEAQKEPARKLLASGGGRCNISNTLDAQAFMASFGKQGRFMTQALQAFSLHDLSSFFAELGVPLASTDGLLVYPRSQSARDVREALVHACRRLQVTLYTDRIVTSLHVNDQMVNGVTTHDGLTVAAPAVLLATGGCGYPELSSGRSGLDLAKSVGHRIVSPLPANVPLITHETWPRELAGLSVSDAGVIIPDGKKTRQWTGSLLFTHRGLSGPVILDASGTIAEQLVSLQPLPVELVFLRQSPLEEFRRHQGKKKLRNALGAVVPNALAQMLCRRAGIADDVTCARLSREQQVAMDVLLLHCPLLITRTEGFSKAMTMRGGVSLKEINPRTMESRFVHGLYFAGEMLDLDAPCGGFQLQWAFSSGFLAAQAVHAAMAM